MHKHAWSCEISVFNLDTIFDKLFIYKSYHASTDATKSSLKLLPRLVVVSFGLMDYYSSQIGKE